MADLVAKCPRCGTETEVKRNIRWRFSVDGTCPNCKVRLTTPLFWEVTKK